MRKNWLEVKIYFLQHFSSSAIKIIILDFKTILRDKRHQRQFFSFASSMNTTFKNYCFSLWNVSRVSLTIIKGINIYTTNANKIVKNYNDLHEHETSEIIFNDFGQNVKANWQRKFFKSNVTLESLLKILAIHQGWVSIENYIFSPK